MKLARHILALWTCAFVVIGSSATSGSMVLCVAPGDHVALEPPTEVCSPSLVAAASSAAPAICSRDQCVGCTDFPVTRANASALRTVAGSLQPAAMPASVADRPFAQAPTARAHEPVSLLSPAPPPRVLPLRL